MQQTLAMWDVQIAVRNTLVNDQQVMQSVSGVFDEEPPASAAPPYILIGEMTESNVDLMTRRARDVTALIHVWSKYVGDKEAKTIGALVTNALANATARGTITADNWHVVTCNFESGQVLMDPNGYRHGIFRFRLYVEAKVS